MQTLLSYDFMVVIYAFNNFRLIDCFNILLLRQNSFTLRQHCNNNNNIRQSGINCSPCSIRVCGVDGVQIIRDNKPSALCAEPPEESSPESDGGGEPKEERNAFP